MNNLPSLGLVFLGIKDIFVSYWLMVWFYEVAVRDRMTFGKRIQDGFDLTVYSLFIQAAFFALMIFLNVALDTIIF